jgi:hypothetical protein
MERDYHDEVRALEATMASERNVAVARLRAIREAWARAILGIDGAEDLVVGVRAVVTRGLAPARAAEGIEQLELAEAHQWEIGTWATGSGEGLSSMREVHALGIAQAWLWAARAGDDPTAAHKARALLSRAEADPNRVARHYQPQIQALQERLDLA